MTYSRNPVNDLGRLDGKYSLLKHEKVRDVDEVFKISFDRLKIQLISNNQYCLRTSSGKEK